MRFQSFSDMLSYYAEVSPDSPAIYYGIDKRLFCTFLEFKKKVDSRADELSKSGKTCIGILTDGSFDCVLTVFGAVLAGLQVVMLDENQPSDILLEQIAYTDVDLLWGDPDLCEELEPALTSGVKSGARQILFFTSGTTDRSKAVVLTDRSLMASAYNGSALLPLSHSDTLLCVLPLHHVFGFVCGLLWGLSCGAAVALGRGPRYYLADCGFYHPTALSAVPLLLGFLLKSRVFNAELRLILIGAGDCPKSLLEAVTSFGIQVAFGYGLTETSSGIALSTSGDPYAMTVCPDDRVTIAQDGEILIQAPSCMMQGYYKFPDMTGQVLKDGTLYSGDLGFLDEEHRLHVTGRKKEIIVLPDGTKIFLPEYERACMEALGTQELCIIRAGDVPALVLGNADSQLNQAEILAKLKEIIEQRPRGQQLKRIIFRKTPLPRTAAGKIKRWIMEQEENNL